VKLRGISVTLRGKNGIIIKHITHYEKTL
jgi:hypothetical protein